MDATLDRWDVTGSIPSRLMALSRDDWTAYREAAARYEAAWSAEADPPVIGDFLPPPGHQPLRSLLLVHLIKEEYERRHVEGEAIAMAPYLDRFPELRADPPALEELRAWERTLARPAALETATIARPVMPEGYRLLRELPGGGMSRLFLVEGAGGALEVLKQIDPERWGRETDLKRFENEIHLAGSLAGRGVAVVPVTWVGRVEGHPAYAMPFCAGGSLRDRLRALGGRPLDPPAAARLVLALARVVQQLQESQPPIVHRDLKPENILFTATAPDLDRPLITDLGLAKLLGQEGPTRSGTALGTWVYMAPEQVRDPSRVDRRADVYSLGVILYECLTGRRPFGGETAPEIIYRIYNETPVDPSKLIAGVPAALEEVVRKCLQKEPAHRYATARELADDLERVLAGIPVQARRPGRMAKVRSWARRHPTEAMAYAAALGALVVGLVVSTVLTVVAADRAREAETQAGLARREAGRADDNAALINGGLGRLVRTIAQDRRFQAAGLTALRSEVLHDAVGLYDELGRRNPGQGTLGLGQALNNQTLLQYLLGEIPQAVALARRAEATLSGLPPTHEARRALADAHKQLGVTQFASGQPAEGLRKTEEAVALYQALVREKPDDRDTRFQLVLATVNLGNFAMQRDPDGAIARYREALADLDALRKESPDDPHYPEWQARTTSNLGLILTATGKIEAAIQAQREAIAAAESVSDESLRRDALATCRINLGEALEQGKRPTEAEAVFRQALDDYQILVARFPNDIDYRWGVALVLTNLARVLDQQGRPREAIGPIEEAAKIFAELSPKLDKNEEFKENRAKHKSLLEAIRRHLDAGKPAASPGK